MLLERLADNPDVSRWVDEIVKPQIMALKTRALSMETGPANTLIAKIMLNFLSNFNVDLDKSIKALDLEIAKLDQDERRLLL